MADTEEKDVLRLFITETAFLAGSKRRQLGIDKATKRLLLHNDTDDTLVDGWSGDSLQLLLASNQTITGIKTFAALTKFGSQYLGRAGNGIRFDPSDNLSIATNIVRDDDTGVLQLFAGKGAAADAKLRLYGPSHVSSANRVDILVGGDRKMALESNGEWFIDIPDNENQALEISTTPGNVKYILINTTTGSEEMSFGNSSENPIYSFLSTKLMTLSGGLNVAKVFGTKQTTQTITSDNDTLLNVDVTSFLVVSTSSTGSPGSFTVGMKAGAFEGHIVHIIVKTDVSAFEIDDSVAGSATIISKTGNLPAVTPLNIEDTTSGAPRSRSFIWNGADTEWQEI